MAEKGLWDPFGTQIWPTWPAGHPSCPAERFLIYATHSHTHSFIITHSVTHSHAHSGTHRERDTHSRTHSYPFTVPSVHSHRLHSHRSPYSRSSTRIPSTHNHYTPNPHPHTSGGLLETIPFTHNHSTPYPHPHTLRRISRDRWWGVPFAITHTPYSEPTRTLNSVGLTPRL